MVKLQNDATYGREKVFLPLDYGSAKPGYKGWWVVHGLDFSPSHPPDSTYPTTGSNASQLPAGATTVGSALRDPWSRGSMLADHGYGSELPVAIGWTGCNHSHQVLQDPKSKQNILCSELPIEPEIVRLWPMTLLPFIYLPLQSLPWEPEMTWHPILALRTRWPWPSDLASLSFSLSSAKQQ